MPHATTRRPRARAGGALAALVALGGGVAGSALLVVGAVSPAEAAEVYYRPANGVFSVEGHGWGHGHGMSQWGAQGAASEGQSADTITATYYAGSARGTLPATPLRVRLSDDGTDVTVHGASGLTATDVATGAVQQLPAGPSAWRAVADASGEHLQARGSSGWKAWGIGGKTTVTGPVRFGGPTFVRVVLPGGQRDYRGTVQAVKTGSSSVATVNVVDIDDYLRGVVPRESSSSWKPAALQAQAIAARTYAAYERAHASGSWDICDTTMCQVYGGAASWSSGGSRTSLEAASTDDAVARTAKVVRTYDGKPLFSQFSSSNGGWTTDGGQPYLKAQQDDWDGAVSNPVHSWTASITAGQLERRFPSVGHLLRVRVTQRDGHGAWGGRVKQVVLEGTDSAGKATSVSTTGVGFYDAHSWPAASDGLRSSWWHITTTTSSSVSSQSTVPALTNGGSDASHGVLTVVLTNNGTRPWGTKDLHLAVSSPVGQADPLVGGSTRPGVLTGATGSEITPGQQATFRVAYDASGQPAGSYPRAYRLRNGAGAAYGATVQLTVKVVDGA